MLSKQQRLNRVPYFSLWREMRGGRSLSLSKRPLSKPGGIFFLITLLTLAGPAVADVQLVAVPSTQSACLGQNFDITIQKQSTDTVDGIDLFLSFDAATLKVNSITNQSTLDFAMKNTINTGNLNFSAISFANTPPSGNFDFITLNVTPLAASAGTALQFDTNNSTVTYSGSYLNYTADDLTVAIDQTCPCSNVTEIPTAQCDTLVSLYDSTDGDNWTTNTDWKQTNTPCSWYGITCANDVVTEIDLHDNNLTGTLPDLSALTSLETLALHSLKPAETVTPNKLTGNIPDLSALINLKVINLGRNQLTGNIPDLSSLTQLTYLSLSVNELTGDFPDLTNLTNLQWLWIGSNQLTGTFPDLTGLTQLKSIGIADNKLTGTLPDLSQFTALEQIWVQKNQFTGNIPDLSALTNLDSIGFYRNQFTGPLPDLSQLTKLQWAHLHTNQLTGTIPELSGLTQLQELGIGNNQIGGTIPDLSNLTKLEGLWVSNNKITGAIPTLSTLTSLTSLGLTGNQLCQDTNADYGNWTEVNEYPDCGNPNITLTSPAHGATEIPITGQVFTWEPDSAASAHRIVISTQADFANFTEAGGGSYCNDTTTCVTQDFLTTNPQSYTAQLSENTTYYWKVRASRNPTFWSEVRSFTTGGLLAHWTFDNCDATDSSNNNFDGVFRGEPTCVDGVQGKGLRFDGDDAIDVDGGRQLAGYNITLSAWAHITENTNGTIAVKYDRVGKNGINYSLGFSDSGNFKVGARTENAIDDQDLGIVYNIQPEELGWVHVAEVLTPESMKLYFNGELKNSMDLPAGFVAYTGTQKLGIGGAPVDMGPSTTAYQNTFLNDAVIDELSVYNYAFSEAQIENLYNTTKPATTGCNGDLQLADNLCEGLTAYYPMDGNANDASGNGSNGVVNGATLTTDRHGNANSAYSFEDDYIQIADTSSLDLSQEFTIQAWINPHDGYGNQRHNHIDIVSKWGDTGIGNAAYLLGINNQGKILPWTYSGSAGSYFEGSQTVPINTWTYVVMVRTGNTSKVYINGTLDASFDNAELPQNSNYDLFIGQAPKGINRFSGMIDDVLIHNRALTASEIQSYYNSTKPSDCTTIIEIPTAQCETLVALYDSTNGDNWTNNTGWKLGNTPCSWFGVTCDNGVVTEIKMPDNNLIGTLPDLSALTGLEHLALYSVVDEEKKSETPNQLTGNLPDLSALTNLKVLWLVGNQLEGPIPDLSGLTQLVSIALGANKLNGPIPESVSTLTNLTFLHLPVNQLTGTVPDLSALTKLQHLSLHQNRLTGTIPELKEQTQLKYFSLSTNQVTGTIPESIGRLTHLTALHLAHNQLTGTIPDLSALTKLEILRLHKNQFTGAIPDLSSFTRLEDINLGENQLTGTIPDLSQLTKLQWFGVYRNQLTGTLPNLDNLTDLQVISVGNNQLTGSLPDLSQLSQLQILGLQDNQLTGPIPDLSPFSDLETLTLTNNQLCQDTNADYGNWTQVNEFPNCAEVKLIAEANTTQACIGQNLTIMINKQLAQTVNEIQMALNYDANLFKINSITNAGPLTQFNANHGNGSAQITAGNFTGISDDFAIASLQLMPLVASVGTSLQFNDSQTVVKLSGAPLRHESQGITLAIKDCVSDIVIQPEDNSAIWTLVEETQAIEQTGENLDAPKSLSFDASGNAYIADTLNHRILKRDTQGNLSVVAGTGIKGKTGDEGPAIEAKLNNPQGVAIDHEGNLYIADTLNHRIRKVDSNGIISTIAGIGKGGYAGDQGLATAAKLRKPTAIVFDSNGHLYIADSGNHRIRKVSGQRTRKPNANSIITTIAGNGKGYRGDNGPATGARLNNPSGLAVDNQNNLYIADTDNHRIRKIDNRGTITTVAGNGIKGYSGDGDPATAAQINAPTGLEVDSTGNLYIADRNNHRIRKVDNEGTITTFTGTGKAGTSTDGILAGVAQITQPSDVALDQYGNLYIADKGNDTIRKIGEQDGEEGAAPPHQIADCPNTEVTGIPKNECYALIALYDSTKGPDWTDNTGWKATDTPCQWTGVTCTNGSVTEINLSNNNLEGDVPPQIGALVNLEVLNLNDNQISGALPTTIEHLNNLETLNVENNALTGSLPAELGDATNLQTVNLANNQISGEIPDLNALTQLQTLNLSENLLNGPVPDLTALTTLQTLNISGEDQQVCRDSDIDYGNMPVGNLDDCPTGNQLPTAAFTATPNKGEAPLTVNLDARMSHDPFGNITAYFWESSDGTVLTGATPSITYEHSGLYEITLKVMDNDGAPSLNIAKHLVEVYPGPDQMTLRLDKDGMGLGTISAKRDKDPATTCNTKCQTESQDYPQDSEIKLTAKAAKGSLFTGWRGDCVGTEADNKIKVTMDSAKHCTAVFELEATPPPQMHALTIDSVFTMDGTGTIEVQDRLCHEPPCMSYHEANKNIKITGTPSPHSYFIGWNRDCPFIGESTDATNLVVLKGDATCIAYFGNDSDLEAIDTAKEFEKEAEMLGSGEPVNEMYPEAYNHERYQQAFRFAEKAMMTVKDQKLLDKKSWPDHFNDIENWFDPLPESLMGMPIWVQRVQIKSGENEFEDGAVIIGDYVHVEVFLLNKNREEELVSILVYYDEEPTIEYPQMENTEQANTRRRKGSKGYACFRG
jgi:Leucine-rich repeat (LRR) protein/sugar lactone lactonase YvrE